MAYSINYTDPANGVVSLPDNETNGPVPGSALQGNEVTDVRFYGENSFNWGEGVNENFLNLLENFASPESAPGVPSGQPELGNGFGINNPITGQQWYNTTDKKMYVYNGTEWQIVSGDPGGPTVDDVTMGSTLMYSVSAEGAANRFNSASSIVFADNVYTNIPYTGVVNNAVNGYNPAEPEFFTVPTGVSWIKVTAAINLRTYALQSSSNGPIIYTGFVAKDSLSEYHNFVVMDTDQYPVNLNITTQYAWGVVMNLASTWMAVTPGQKFSITLIPITLGRSTCYGGGGFNCKQTKLGNVGNYMLVEYR